MGPGGGLALDENERIGQFGADFGGEPVGERTVIILVEVEGAAGDLAEVIGAQQTRPALGVEIPDAVLAPDALETVFPQAQAIWVEQAGFHPAIAGQV